MARKRTPIDTCIVCNFSGPHCLCTRPLVDLVRATCKYMPGWGVFNLEQAPQYSAGIRHYPTRIRLEGLFYRLVDVVWLFEHGRWPAGYVEDTAFRPDRIDISRLREHLLPANTPPSREYLPPLPHSDRGDWYAAGFDARGQRLNFGTFYTPEEAWLAWTVESAKVEAGLGVNPGPYRLAWPAPAR